MSGSHVFRVQAVALPDPELVVSDEVLEEVDAVPYLDDDTAAALKGGACVIADRGRAVRVARRVR